jgi:hypothetical protein
MLDRRTTLVYLAAGAAVAGSAWITFVPDSVSGSTFGSILAVTIGLLVVSTTALRSSRSTRSAADVRHAYPSRVRFEIAASDIASYVLRCGGYQYRACVREYRRTAPLA